MSIKWSDDKLVGVAAIDEQHKRFIDSINSLYQAINDHQAEETLSKAFAGLEDYILDHFSTEEKLFKQTAYPQTAAHVAAHREFEARIKDFKSRVAGNETEISFALVDFLEDWLIDHLENMDQLYIEHFKKHGIN